MSIYEFVIVRHNDDDQVVHIEVGPTAIVARDDADARFRAGAMNPSLVMEEDVSVLVRPFSFR